VLGAGTPSVTEWVRPPRCCVHLEQTGHKEGSLDVQQTATAPYRECAEGRHSYQLGLGAVAVLMLFLRAAFYFQMLDSGDLGNLVCPHHVTAAHTALYGLSHMHRGQRHLAAADQQALCPVGLGPQQRTAPMPSRCTAGIVCF
jgi:hypothetical protein